MEGVMAGRRSADHDYEDRFWSMLIKRMDDQDKKLDEIVTQTRKTNGRVTKLESKVYSPPERESLPLGWRNPKVISIAFYGSLAFLLLVAAATGFDIGALL